MVTTPDYQPGSDDDADLLLRLSAILVAGKTLTTQVRWVDTHGDLRFTATLDSEGVTVEGLTLFGRASASLPGTAVTFGLRWAKTPGRYDHFDRLDWKPSHVHNNKGLGAPEWRFRPFQTSHHHSLVLNAATEVGLLNAMADNLPVAEPVIPEPANWEAILALVGERWNITDLINVPYPPWQYDILQRPGAASRRGEVKERPS
jgi:hypothetical protein